MHARHNATDGYVEFIEYYSSRLRFEITAPNATRMVSMGATGDTADEQPPPLPPEEVPDIADPSESEDPDSPPEGSSIFV